MLGPVYGFPLEMETLNMPKYVYIHKNNLLKSHGIYACLCKRSDKIYLLVFRLVFYAFTDYSRALNLYNHPTSYTKDQET